MRLLTAVAILALTSFPGVSVQSEEKKEQTILDFGRDDDAEWRIVNDGVMGGVSQSRLHGTADGTALFEGDLSLENNGGFASVRAWLTRRDLSQFTGFALRVRGDGQRYRLRVRTDQNFDGVAYDASFETTADTWQEIHIPFSKLKPTFRGRTLDDVGPLDTRRVQQIGFMITDRQVGRFQLEIDWVRAYAQP